MSATHIWFGPAERPLAGWWHAPDDGTARGAIVLCPPLGVEYLGSYRTFRLLALALEQQGFAALRFDYDGTGDSAGWSDDAGRVEAWLRSVELACARARDARLPWLALVGMRIGATLAATAAKNVAPDALVLWDPCRTGRMFLREQRALLMTGVGASPVPVEGTETPGFVFDPATTAALGELDLVSLEQPLAPLTLVLAREDRPEDQRLVGAFTDAAWDVASGQANLVDVEPLLSEVPEAALERVRAWLYRVAPEGRVAVAPVQDSDEVVLDADGVAVRERAVFTTPTQLFGIECRSEQAHDGARETTVVFINTAIEPHVGPSRLWVELARRWAARGLSSVRFDMSGVAESPARPGVPEHIVYSGVTTDDIVELARTIRPDDPERVALVGLCSGGYVALDACSAITPAAVIAVNAFLTYKPIVGGVAPRGRRCVREQLRQISERPLLFGIKRRFPPRVWRVLDRLHVEPLPTRCLETLVANGSRVVLIFDDAAARPLQQRAPHTLEQLAATGRFRMVIPRRSTTACSVPAHAPRWWS